MILMLEVTDLMFALDSVSAKIAAAPGLPTCRFSTKKTVMVFLKGELEVYIKILNMVILKIFQSFVMFCHFVAEMLVRSASQSVCFEKIPNKIQNLDDMKRYTPASFQDHCRCEGNWSTHPKRSKSSIDFGSMSPQRRQVPNQFIAYSSTVMAVFSLRAAFFIVHDLVQQIEVRGKNRSTK